MVTGLRNSREQASIAQLGYMGIGVSDIEAWREFATTVLGLQDNGSAEDGSLFLRMDDYHHRLILTPTGEDDMVFHGWEVKDAAALQQIAAQIRAYGIEVTEGTPEEAASRMVLGLIKFNDPDGAPTEIYHGALVDHRPFISPRGIKKFTAGELGLGHFVMGVADPQEFVRFYTEVLGIKISDHIMFASETGPPSVVTFMHANARHHSMAVSKRGAGVVGRRLNHIMLEAGTLDDVGRAYDAFNHKGIEAGGLGRHTNDKMISFYGVTPSGFRLEFGCGGLQIRDEEKWEVSHHVSASIWRQAPPLAAAAS